MWARDSTPRTNLSLAASSLTLIVATSLGYQTHLEHRRSLRPSILLTFYFFFTTLFDIPHARTLWAIEGLDKIASLFIVSMIVKAAILCHELIEKKHLFHEADPEQSPEAWVGSFNRSLFWWLNPLFLVGARKAFSLGDLFPVEQVISSGPILADRVAALWENCMCRTNEDFSPLNLALWVELTIRVQPRRGVC